MLVVSVRLAWDVIVRVRVGGVRLEQCQVVGDMSSLMEILGDWLVSSDILARTANFTEDRNGHGAPVVKKL